MWLTLDQLQWQKVAWNDWHWTTYNDKGPLITTDTRPLTMTDTGPFRRFWNCFKTGGCERWLWVPNWEVQLCIWSAQRHVCESRRIGNLRHLCMALWVNTGNRRTGIPRCVISAKSKMSHPARKSTTSLSRSLHPFSRRAKHGESKRERGRRVMRERVVRERGGGG